MTAQERLTAARVASLQGNHDFALQEFIWFHYHARAEQPSLAAVRLSYALSYWRELGDVYPEAMRAFVEARDRKVALLRLGVGGRRLFHDVVAMNETLETSGETYLLYLYLSSQRPKLAARCAQLALPAIVDAKDYRLARQIARNPEEEIVQDAISLNASVQRIKQRAYTDAPQRWCRVQIYVDGVRRHLAILRGNDENAEAERLRALAISLVKSPSLRKEVQAEFIKPSTAPAPPRFRKRPRRRRLRKA